jgi:hypothetical protein
MKKNEKWTLLKYHWDETADPCMVIDEILEEYEVSDPTDILAIVTDYVAEHESDAASYRWANTTGDPLDWEYYQGGFDAAFNGRAVYGMFPSHELEEVS